MAFRKQENTRAETIVFNGFRYNRYPESKNKTHQRYFGRAGHLLHRDIWEFHNGPIPEGYQIHHIDRDTTNNDIANLDCLPRKVHRQEHHDEYVARGKEDAQLQHLKHIQPRAKEWHGSDEGREWHRRNALTSIRSPDAPKPYSKSHYVGICEWCGSGFEAKSPKKTMCSSGCVEKKSKYIRGILRKCHEHYASRL